MPTPASWHGRFHRGLLRPPILQRGVPPTLSATPLLVSTVSVPLLTLGCGSRALAELHLPCLSSQLESWQCLWWGWELSYQHPPWEAWACACTPQGAALAWGPQPVCHEALIKVWQYKAHGFPAFGPLCYLLSRRASAGSGSRKGRGGETEGAAQMGL